MSSIVWPWQIFRMESHRKYRQLRENTFNELRRHNPDREPIRLLAATRWLRSQPATAELPIGYFGASTGAAAALPGTPGPLPVLKGFASLRRLAGTYPAGHPMLTQKLKEGWFKQLGVNAIWITAPYEQIHGWVQGGQKEFKHYAYHGYYALDYTVLDKNMGTPRRAA